MPSLTEVRAERCRRSLAEFIRWGWHVVEPDEPLTWTWHIDAICIHLEACTRLQIWKPDSELRPEDVIGDLLINIPPGTMKSLIVSVFWPAWEWINHPEIRSLFASYAQELALRDSVRCRDLIESDWYQDWFRPAWKLKGDQNLKSWFANTAGGFRMALGVGGKTTGFRGHKVVVDDPHNAKDALSDAIRSDQNEWWFKRASTRVNDLRKRVRVVVMQRLHTKDLSGEILAKGGYEHLCLPMEFDPDRKCRTKIGFEDPRTEAGELLCPVRWGPEELEPLRRELGSAGYAGQYNQKPAPAGGLMFKRHWWRYWQPKGANLPPVRVQLEDGSYVEIEPIEIPEKFDELLQSWDMTFKDTAGADNVAGGVWGRKGAQAFLLDQVCEKLDFVATVAAVERMSGRWPNATAKLVEDKANGPAVIAYLRGRVAGLIPIEPDGGKVARANAVLPVIESGDTFVPHPLVYDWVDPYLGEHDVFPNGANDDQVDQTTQALRRIHDHCAPEEVTIAVESSQAEISRYQPR